MKISNKILASLDGNFTNSGSSNWNRRYFYSYSGIYSSFRIHDYVCKVRFSFTRVIGVYTEGWSETEERAYRRSVP